MEKYRITWHCQCGNQETLEYVDDKIDFGDDPLCDHCGEFMAATEEDIDITEEVER